jgi:hypothetical protein
VADDADARDETLEDYDSEILVIERVALNDSEDGKVIASAFVDQFGRYISEIVRPVLRRVAASGGEPQLLVNGLAELLRLTADSIEFPVGVQRPNRALDED